MGEGKAEHSRRMLLLLGPAAFSGAAQLPESQVKPEEKDRGDVRLPNGKRQMDEILKADHEHNVQDARELAGLAASFETEMEKTDRFVLSLPLLKKLDDMDKLIRRMRGRIRK